mgnify:CR=1 FL=1
MSKIKVHELAKELEKQSREVIAFLQEKGIEVKAAQSSVEEDAAEMDYDTAEAESEVSESTGETDESETDLQYHFTEGDVASILTWKEQYFSEGYEQNLPKKCGRKHRKQRKSRQLL